MKQGWLTLANVSMWVDADRSEEVISGPIVPNVKVVQAGLANLGLGEPERV